jgi:aspartate 1-decarboxylase
MTVEMLKGKIHRATVIQAELDYVGSITKNFWKQQEF